jgi:hypothetical protein
MKKIVILFAILILSGCNQVIKEEQIPVSGKIVFNGEEYQMRTGHYEYNGEKMKIGVVDKEEDPIKLAEQFETLNSDKNSIIKIVIEDEPKLSVKQFNENGTVEEVELKDKQITLPSKRGNYIYEITGKWSDGVATYVFDVDVQ